MKQKNFAAAIKSSAFRCGALKKKTQTLTRLYNTWHDFKSHYFKNKGLRIRISRRLHLQTKLQRLHSNEDYQCIVGFL